MSIDCRHSNVHNRRLIEACIQRYRLNNFSFSLYTTHTQINMPPSATSDFETNGVNGQNGTNGSSSSPHDNTNNVRIPLNDQYAFTPRKLRVITIGAGFSGLLMAQKFQHRYPEMQEYMEHTIYERNSDIGGTVGGHCAVRLWIEDLLTMYSGL